MALSKSVLALLLTCLAVSAAPLNNEKASGSGKRWASDDNSWQNQWQPDSSGVVHYGFGGDAWGAGYNNATQLRLAYRGCDGMAVSFSTNYRNDQPEVLYGTSEDNLDQKADSSVSITYETSPKWQNHVVLSGLQSNTKYYYQVCGGPIQSFMTARCAGDMTPYTAAVVVDMGAMGYYGLSHDMPADIGNPIPEGQLNTVQRLVAQIDDYDFIAHPGDMAYADYWVKEQLSAGSNLTLQDQVLGYNVINEAFFDEIAEVSSQKAYMVAVGNHEANCDNGGYKDIDESVCVAGLTNFTEYKARWNMPGDGSFSNNFWYSFDMGMTHYLFFDTETDFPAPYKGPESKNEANVGSYANAQVDWIKQDLAGVDRSKTPWVIAMGHRPWYTADAPKDQFLDGLGTFEQLFVDGEVDMVVHGHKHWISRSYPVWENGTIQQKDYVNPKAPVYIVNGAAGHYDGLDKISTPLNDYVAFANDTLYSYSLLNFHNSTHLTHTFMASGDNSVIDSITLERQH